MSPEAPGRFSTTTAWPSPRVTLSAIRRAITSVAPPGPVGTMSLIGRLPGQLCAYAACPASDTQARAATITAPVIEFMGPSLRRRFPPGRERVKASGGIDESPLCQKATSLDHLVGARQ